MAKINLAEYQATITCDASKFKKGMDEADSSFSSFSSKMGNICSGIVTGVTVAIGAAATSMVAFGKSSIDTGMEFDSAVSQIAATMGTTADQITDLRDKAIELGSTTSFSATQAAEGLNILAMSGLDAEEQMAAIDDVLNLAAAGSIEMADAASYAVGAIKGFGDEFSNTQYYADLMAKGATLAATDVNGLGEALSSSSATAASFGQSAEDTTVALLRLAEQNVTGSAAATALSRAMYDLYTPTESAATALDKLGISAYDANGNAKEFNSVVDELNTALAGMSEEEANAYKASIFTAQGLKAFNMMTVSSTEKVNEFREGLASASDGIGAAAQQAETMLDNLQGDITIFGSAVEGLQIGVSDSVNGLMRDCVQFGTEQIGILTEAVKENGLTGLAGAVGEVLSNLITKIGEYVPKLLDLGVQMVKSFVQGITDNADKIANIAVEIYTTLMSGLAEIIPMVVEMVLKVFIAVSNALAQQLPTLIPIIVQGILNIVQTILDNLPLLLNALLEVIKGLAQGIIDSLPIILEALPEIISGIVDFIVGAIPAIISAIIEIVTAILEYLPEIINSIVDVLVECIPIIIEGIITLINAIVEALPTLITAICEALPGIITSIINAIIELLPVLIDGLIQLILGIVDALPEIIKALIEALPQIITAVINGLVEALPQLIMGLIQLVVSLVEHLPEIITALIEALPEIIEAVVNGLIECLPQLIEGSIQLVIGLVEHLPEIIMALIEAIPTIVTSIIDAFGGLVSGLFEVGRRMVEGLWDGICSLGSWIWDEISGFCSGIWEGVCNFFGIHSPSRLMAYAGEMIVVGLSNAITENTDEAVKASEYLADNVLDTFDGMVDDISSIEEGAFNDVDIHRGVTIDEVYNGADVPVNATASFDDYSVVGFSREFENYLNGISLGYQGGNNTTNSVVIQMGDISVSGVLDKDAAEQVRDIADGQIDDVVGEILPLIPQR